MSKASKVPQVVKATSVFLKINFDPVWDGTAAGVGSVVCDTEGFVHGGGAFFMQHVVNAGWAEAACFLHCLDWAKSKNIN